MKKIKPNDFIDHDNIWIILSSLLIAVLRNTE